MWTLGSRGIWVGRVAGALAPWAVGSSACGGIVLEPILGGAGPTGPTGQSDGSGIGVSEGPGASDAPGASDETATGGGATTAATEPEAPGATSDASTSGSDVGCIALWRDRMGLTFEAPVPVAELNSPAFEADPVLSTDGLEIWFASMRLGGLGGYDIYHARRASLEAPFEAPRALSEVNSPADDTAFAPTPDGLVAYFASDRPGGAGGADVFVTRRSGRDAAFELPQPVQGINTALHEYDPFPGALGKHLYGTRIAVGAVDPAAPETLDLENLWQADRGASVDAVTAVRPMEVERPEYDSNPKLSADERVLVFGSGAVGAPGDHDVFAATRSSETGSFEAAWRIDALSSPAYDGEPSLTADACEVWFVSERPDGAGGWDIYRARVRRDGR